MTCSREGIKSTYIGETHRTLFDRSKEHEQALRTKNNKYSIVKHWEEMHSNRLDPPEYSYRVLKSHKTSFERQIWEGILINNKKCDNKLNCKGKWGINLIPTIKVTTPLGDPKEPTESNQQMGPGQNNS